MCDVWCWRRDPYIYLVLSTSSLPNERLWITKLQRAKLAMTNIRSVGMWLSQRVTCKMLWWWRCAGVRTAVWYTHTQARRLYTWACGTFMYSHWLAHLHNDSGSVRLSHGILCLCLACAVAIWRMWFNMLFFVIRSGWRLRTTHFALSLHRRLSCVCVCLLYTCERGNAHTHSHTDPIQNFCYPFR